MTPTFERRKRERALVFLVSARETGGGPYQPSMTLQALTAFFS